MAVPWPLPALILAQARLAATRPIRPAQRASSAERGSKIISTSSGMSKTRLTADILIVDGVQMVATRLCDVGAIREPQEARAKVNVIACETRADQL